MSGSAPGYMPPFVSQAALARELGVSKQAVNQAIRQRRIELLPDGKLDLPASVARWRSTSGGTGAENGRGNAGGRAPEGPTRGHVGGQGPESGGEGRSGPDYHVGRAVRETYMAKLARLRYEQQTGSLIDAEETSRHYFALARDARDKLLALADRLGPAMAPIVDARACTLRLREEFVKLALELSGGETNGADKGH